MNAVDDRCWNECIPGSYLVDDSGPWLPEADAILGSSRGQEVVHFLVRFDGMRQIRRSTKRVVPGEYQTINFIQCNQIWLFIRRI